MKKLTSLLSLAIAVATFLFIQKSSLDKRFLRDDDEPFESVIGDKDNPDAAFRFRYAMLAGNQQNIDLVQMRREAIGYTNQMMKSARSLNKTSAVMWTALGPGNIGGRVRSIVIHPTNSSVVLAGSVAGGIWKTTDGGATWKPKGDSLDFMAISSMVIDPINNNVVYAGTGEVWGNLDAVYGGGIYKSTNFGDTWTLLASTSGASASSFRNVMKLAADGSGNIYAATKNYTYKYGQGEYTVAGGLFKSTNGGTSWTKISSTDFATNYFTPTDVIPITSSTIIYVVGKNGTTNGGIYRTTDGGTGWTKIASNLPTSNYGRIALAQDPSNSNTLYSVFESYDTTTAGDAGLKGIYKSTDAGITWTQLTSPPKIVSTGNMSYLKNQGSYDNVIAVDPNNSNNIYVGGIDMMKSTNGGSSWSQLTYWHSYYGSPVVHADHHALVFDKNNANTFYSGNDGGVYKTTNGGASWTMLNNGLEITQFYSGAVYKSGATYHGGTQDNGQLKYSGSGTMWTTVFGGDGGYSAQDQSNSSVMYEEYVYLEMRKSTDGGVNWNSSINGLTDAKDASKCLFIAPFTMNPENSSVLVAGSDKVWVTSNSASSWTQSSNTLSTSNKVSAVTVVNASANYLGFAGTTDGKIFKCTSLDPASGIDTWTDITPAGNNGGWVRRVVVDLNNKNKIYATYGGYNTSGTLTSRHVWYSTDQGSSWTDISGNLPNVPVHTFAIDPSSSTTLYVGTETGVYLSMNSGGTWASFNAGMPLYVPTDELVIQKDTKALFAFTHGRSVFTTPLSTSSPGWTTVKGDVNLGGTITSADALLVLNYVVNPVAYPLTAQQLYAADVNNDGQVGAYDAASILVKAGGGNFLPKQAPAAGTVAFGKFSNEKGVFTLPINLENTAGVNSFYSEVQLGNSVEFTGVNSRLPEGWVMASNFENGTLKIAMAGLTPLTNGAVALVNLSLKDKDASVSIQGNAVLNDQLAGALNAVKVKEIPSEFSLSQNYPNPFNPTTIIKFTIPQSGRYSIGVYNILGQLVSVLAEDDYQAGYYKVTFDASELASGMYIYRLSGKNVNISKKMVLMK